MTAQPLMRIVVTGPECTGKTTLAQMIAAHLAAPLSREFARDYVDLVNRPLTADDVDPIARGQTAAEDAAMATARAARATFVVLDTDIVSTCVYARHYYGQCARWIEQAARVRLGDLYLLLLPDVPWESDGFQREAPERRDELIARFRDTLKAFGANIVEVGGDWDDRRAVGLAAIDRLPINPLAP